MKTQTWNFIDKSQWPERGPWDSEPDKVQWEDPTTHYPCIALRNKHQGFWCGYVGVTEGHPAFGKEYSDVDVTVHGGLTYSDPCQKEEKEHGICHIPEAGEPDNVYWLGFDCAHYLDHIPATNTTMLEIRKKFPHPNNMETYRDLDYVKDECRWLAAQLAGMEVQ